MTSVMGLLQLFYADAAPFLDQEFVQSFASWLFSMPSLDKPAAHLSVWPTAAASLLRTHSRCNLSF